MRRGRALGLTVAVLVVGACGSDQVARRSEPSRSPASVGTASSEEKSSGEDQTCSEEIPFDATYLPGGFEHKLVPGPAPRGRPRDGEEQVIFHFRGSNGRAIEVRRPGTLFVELAQGDDAPTIHVLGEDTAAFGPINPGGNEFIVFITYPSNADPEDQCAWFSLNEVGVSLAELKKVAEGLREI